MTSPDIRDAEAGCHSYATLTIDLGAIASNYEFIAGQARQASCAAVVKADAYGLGISRVAPALARAGCRCFFVALVGEGVALRTILGPDYDICVLNGATPGSETDCVAHNLIPVLNDFAQLRAWKALARLLGHRLSAILQVDSGMARFGFSLAEAHALLDEPDALKGVSLKLVMSHLACADVPESGANAAQLASFVAIRRRLPQVPACLAASSGTFLGPDFHFDMVRPGAALYGIAPQPGRNNPMRPVVGLCARVMQVRTVPAGTPVGYGHAAATGRASQLATVAVGYADGFPRGTDCAAGFLAGARLPMIGRVSMDSLVLDVTDLPPGAIGPGVPVDLIGPEQGVDALAAASGTIGYEVLTRLGRRFHRIYREA